jgi:hypothetical protein
MLLMALIALGIAGTAKTAQADAVRRLIVALRVPAATKVDKYE